MCFLFTSFFFSIKSRFNIKIFKELKKRLDNLKFMFPNMHVESCLSCYCDICSQLTFSSCRGSIDLL